MPFFSRRIGLSSAREVVPVRFAGKLTGWLTTITLIYGCASGQGRRRVLLHKRLRWPSESEYFRAILCWYFLTTIGDTNSDELNTVNGLDFKYRNSNVLGGRSFVANAYALGSYTEGEGGLEPAWGANVKLYDRNLDLEAGVMEIGDEFNPALGFVRRRGYDGIISRRSILLIMMT